MMVHAMLSLAEIKTVEEVKVINLESKKKEPNLGIRGRYPQL